MEFVTTNRLIRCEQLQTGHMNTPLLASRQLYKWHCRLTVHPHRSGSKECTKVGPNNLRLKNTFIGNTVDQFIRTYLNTNSNKLAARGFRLGGNYVTTGE